MAVALSRRLPATSGILAVEYAELSKGGVSQLTLEALYTRRRADGGSSQ
jgi:hypothetical protein